MGGGDGKVDSPVRVRRHHRHPFLSVSISAPKGTGERCGYRREFIFKRGGRGRPTDRPTRGGGRGCARTPPAPERAREHPIAQPRHPTQHGRRRRRCRRRRLRGITDGQPGKQPLSEAKETVLPRPPPREQARCTDYSIAAASSDPLRTPSSRPVGRSVARSEPRQIIEAAGARIVFLTANRRGRTHEQTSGLAE